MSTYPVSYDCWFAPSSKAGYSLLRGEMYVQIVQGLLWQNGTTKPRHIFRRNKMAETSEFGKGLTYCIGLFLAHAEREIHNTGTDRDYHLWFNGASDHLYDLDLSKVEDKSLKEKLVWREKILHWGHGFSRPIATEKDFNWSVQQAKDFLREIDNIVIGIKTIQGQWE